MNSQETDSALRRCAPPTTDNTPSPTANSLHDTSGTSRRRRPVIAHSLSNTRLHWLRFRAETGRKTSFSAGFVIGGVICGVLGFLYAPQVCRGDKICVDGSAVVRSQISKALLDEQQRLRVPRFLRDRTPRPVGKRYSHTNTVAIIDGTVRSVPLISKRDFAAFNVYRQRNLSKTQRP